MTLPPPWYVFLLAATLLAAPFILRRAATRETRRFAVRMIGGLLLFESGLLLLFYAKILCWPLVAAGIAMIASLAHPQKGRQVAGLLLAPAVAAGIGFQVLDGVQAFYFYFGFAVPFLLLGAIAAAVARWMAGPDRRLMAGAAALVMFGALSPASAFGFTFLVHYEVFQLPVLLIALFGLYTMVGPRGGASLASQWRVDPGATVAGRLAAPWRTKVGLGGPLMLGGLLFGVLALRHAPLPAPFDLVAWGLVALAAGVAVALLFAPVRRFAAPLLVFGGLAGVSAGLIGVRFGAEAFHVFIGGGPASQTIYFYQAGAGSLLLSLGAALGLARSHERAARERLASDPSLFVQEGPPDALSLPRGFLVERLPSVPGIAELEACAERVRADGARGGILLVTEASLDPFTGLPDATHEWLDQQSGGPLVHVAVREGREVFLLPFVDPQEMG